MSTESASAAVGRLHGLDALRGIMMVVVVIGHSACAYAIAIPDWPIVYQPSIPLSLVPYFNMIFGITVFLLISGFAGRAQCERRGDLQFLKDRALRIALPLAVFWPIVRYAYAAMSAWGDHKIRASGGVPPPHPWNDALLSWAHLWFLLLLFQLCVLAYGVRRLPLAGIMPIVDRAVAAMFATRLAPFVLAIPFTLATTFVTGWIPWFGMPTPAIGFIPNIFAFSAYATAFAAGWVLHRQPEYLRGLKNVCISNLLIGFAIMPAQFALMWFMPPQDPTPILWRFALGGSYALMTWFLSLGLLGAALRWLDRPGTIMSALNASAYWIFLVHMPLVWAIQIALFGVPGPAEGKFLLNVIVTLTVLYGSYVLLVRGTWIDSWLNNRKRETAPKASLAGR